MNSDNRVNPTGSSVKKSIATKNITNSGSSSDITENEIEDALLDITSKISELNSIKEDMNSFNISNDELVFFDRKLRPLVDIIYFLSLSSSSIANTAQLMQNNTYGRKREIRHAIDLTYEMNKEIEELFKVLRKRSCIFREGINIAIDRGENSLEYYKKDKEE
ncbi:hypothetical protein HMPREF1092_01392 [Clostridium thermobutyricum]|uniref:Uncharacterized protein n=1 Tax=Clostridium thermobutyricum TaxID=29372 RepID=N9Y2X8_9CLOT|nr:hypothetical protein [Clostridium thermobutyricum]ENZ02157.1 hypothetical protein HMPREF1092_01392 [Clostridium thermobutyricum]